MRLLSIRFILSLAIASSAFFAHATTVTAITSGSWITPQTWSCNCVPKRTDTIIIPLDITVIVTRPLTLGPSIDGKALVITVAGKLELTNGSIQLDSSDRVIVLPGGQVVAKDLGGMIFSGIYSLYLEGGTHVDGPATLGDGFLPVALLFFNAEKNESGVLLTWASAGETNVATYDISRSADGITFEPVGSKSGQGSSRRRNNYSLTDRQHAEGLVYYRIDATDVHGSRAVIATLQLKPGNSQGKTGSRPSSTNDFTGDSPRR